MNWRKWNNILHRDLGYFFFGLTIIYAISGFAVNHMHDFDSNLVTQRDTYELTDVSAEMPVDRELVNNILKQTGETGNYQSHFRSTPGRLQIFVNGGIVDVDLASAQAIVERKKNRPFFREMNYLHLNHPKRLWTYVADIYAVGLFLLAITGLFVLRGKNSLKGRGKWFVTAGIILPVAFLLFYFY